VERQEEAIRLNPFLRDYLRTEFAIAYQLDLHLSAGLPPMIRVHGDVRRINLPPMDHKDVHGMIYDIMNDGQRKAYEEHLEIDFSFAIPGLARFRVNAYNQDRGAAAVLRTIPSTILSLEQLNAPKIFGELALKPRGLVLVTGPTMSTNMSMDIS
jgi:twitching motility protein PilT